MSSQRDLPNLIGEDDAFLAAVEQASAAAALDRPVLVIGERGTGKELIAARVHFLSPRWSEDYVALNCAALSDELLETELFGHTAGAFTGAVKARIGRFEMAHGGSLFLDELASMSLLLQEKLLRVIEYGEFERVGSSHTQRVNVRLIAAANVDLPAAAAAGRFRADLLDRLSFEVITLPPLRARPGDIDVLARHFAEAMCRELGREHFPGFSRRAMQILSSHDWPGNVRELRNVVERAVYRQGDDGGLVDHIVIDPFASPFRPAAQLGTQQSSQDGQLGLPASGIPADFSAHVAAVEVQILDTALKAHQYHQRNTAQALGLSYDQLRHLLKKHGIGRS